MLTQIDVLSVEDHVETVELSMPILGVTPKTSLLIRKITGLDPADINNFIGDYARDGGTYGGRRVGVRNPVFTIGLNPNPALGETVSSMRSMLYQRFIEAQPDADYVKIILREDDGRVRYLVGYVEKFEADIFSDDTMCQISAICPDPFIRDEELTNLTHPTGWITVPFNYQGDAETGFETEITVTVSTPTLTVANNNKTMVFTDSFQAGDVIVLNTNPGSPSAKRTRGATTSSILGKLSPASPWLSLRAKSNQFKVYGTTSTDIVASIKRLTYRASYRGV